MQNGSSGTWTSLHCRCARWPIWASITALLLACLNTPAVGQIAHLDPEPILNVPLDLPSPNAVRISQVPNLRSNELPQDFALWWEEEVKQPLRQPSSRVDMTIDNVVLGTLMYSPHVRVLTDSAQVRRTGIVQQQAVFDPRAYMQTNFVNTSDPVGSLLTTGGASRFLDQNWNYTAGVKDRTATGAQFEATQRLGYQQNNSIYFVPDPQGTSKIALSVTQPLLNGAGKAYNMSLIVLADIDASIARDQMCKDIQDVVFKVHQGYWTMYVQRTALAQKRRLQWQARQILNELNSRREIDVLGSQLVRANAAVAMREAATIRYGTEVQNAEAKLRAIINDPALLGDTQLELIPVQKPNCRLLEVDLVAALAEALCNRPEVNQANRQMRAAAVRAGVSQNEVLPVLNLLLGTYVYGLQGNGDIAAAYGNQFDRGRPTYSAGMYFEIPYGNRAANARLLQRRLELRQAANQLQIITANLRAEVEIAAREVTTAYREMVSKYHSMAAYDAEVQFLTERWRLLPGDQQVAGVVLNDLLNAQERLADASFGFVTALADYNVALIDFKRTTGTLLQYQEVQEVQINDGGLPTTIFTVRGVGPTPGAAPHPGMPLNSPAGVPSGSPVPSMVRLPRVQ
jgi:outer membrane protein TolC